MKRQRFLVIGLVGVLSILAACGNSSSGNDANKIASTTPTTTRPITQYSTLESLVAHLASTQAVCLKPFYALDSGPQRGIFGSPGGTTNGRVTCTEGGIFFIDIGDSDLGLGSCKYDRDKIWIEGGNWILKHGTSQTSTEEQTARSIIERIAADEGLKVQTCP